MNKGIFRLILGFRRFREKYYLQEHDETSVYHKLSTAGQNPKTLLIGCSDSRVDPAILTGASPGELFVVRNVANLVPPCESSLDGFHGTSSALEFAVMNLKVENIIVLGHRQCGGIRALMTSLSTDKKTFISQWMSIAEEAKQNVLREHKHTDIETQIRLGEMEALKISIRNLKTFSFIKEAVEAQTLSLIAVYFDLELGELWQLDDATQKFKRLEV